MAVKVQIEGLANAINTELKLYSQNIRDGIDRVGEKNIKDLVEDTKNTAPVGKRRKHYKNSIKYKTRKSRLNTWFIWYVNGSDYRLSHLLENGHALRNGGRIAGTHFIQKATDKMLENYEKDVEEVIKND
jgi:hypothetical protein